MDYNPPGSSVHGILQAGKNTGVGSQLSFLQGIFLTQGSNLCLLLGKWNLTPEPPGKPYILDSVIYFNLTKSTGSKLCVEVED